MTRRQTSSSEPYFWARVVAIHRVCDLQVGICVEAREELLGLIAEVALDGERGAEARGVRLQPLLAICEPRLLRLAAEAAV